MRKFFTMLALLLALVPVAGSAQFTNLTSNYSFVGTAGNSYQINYLGSGGASYWNSLWAVSFDGTNVSGTPTLLFCKNVGCGSNTFTAPAQTVFEGQATDVFTSATPWVLGFYVETSGSPDITPDASGLWLYSFASLNPASAGYLRDFGNAGVYQDNRTTLIPGTDTYANAGFTVVGLEDIVGRNGPAGDRDFNDGIFAIQDLGNTGTPSEVVPEPATMTLLATGLAGMAAARRKRKQV